jgi:hypothetical protein
MLIVTFRFGDVNQGEKICLRLRPAHAPDTFIDEQSVVQTMLHEVRSVLAPFPSFNGNSVSLLTTYMVHMMRSSTSFYPSFKTNTRNSEAQAMPEKDSSPKDSG